MANGDAHGGAMIIMRRSDVTMTKKIPVTLEKHGHTRMDPYFWLKQRENPEVIDFLNQENRYTESKTAHLKGLEDELFEEIKGRIVPDDATVPYKMRDFYYYSRYEQDKEYPVFFRKAKLDGPDELVVDENEMAEHHDFFDLKQMAVSPAQNLVALATDTVGRRIYQISFKNLETGELLDDVLQDATGSMAWANDNQTLFYAVQDLETLRPYRVYRHVLGTDPAQDQLVYEEKDDRFYLFVSKTKSRKFILIGANQTLSSEYRFLNADHPTRPLTLFQPRTRDHEYSIDHLGERFYILTNHQARNFRLMTAKESETGLASWEERVPHREDVFLEGMELFQNHMVLEERKDGLTQLQILPMNGQPGHYLDFGETAYLAYLGNNCESDTQWLRFGYTSMTTPSTIYDYHMITGEKKLLKQQKVLGGFATENYRTERRMAQAQDGTMIPISLVYGKETPLDGSAPLLLYGYGSYGISMDPSFSAARLSLLDRGFVYAIAHIRGGQEMGRPWYENGKLLTKKNSFTDFIACGEYLIREKWAAADKLFAMGGSAGGLLMGAVINMRPDLFKGVIAAVPFVDVVTTMLDESIPLTTSEYDEWGNPNDPDYYHYILSYSPYDNVAATDYPHLLVTTGFHDSQVQYWEPAKWVAKLREVKTDSNLLLLKTDMDVGHGGATGRYKQHHETAFNYAFLLHLAKETT